MQHEREGSFERKLKEGPTKTRDQIYKELPRKQKIAYLIFVVSVFDLSWFFIPRSIWVGLCFESAVRFVPGLSLHDWLRFFLGRLACRTLDSLANPWGTLFPDQFI
ncbi:hypothetical protein EH244_30405 [Variovorax beijingensis]|uniref:Uncharacterized protein n=1 Tax=Variovorax beijingensis TaxID=2496117 RepID=A0A3P3E282_9BURK|nr:hypothetical protein [Variovorax beijingensis]RRH80603.1 hypothetical protein EH244_30405 [Variovorax beijingensis]